LAYIFDPIRNTFVDDEDTSLGNKLALNDTSKEIIRQIDEQFGPGTVFPASELPPKENPYKDFEDRNPAADGGMMRQNFYKGMSANKAPQKIKLKDPDTLTGFAGDRKLTQTQIDALDPNYLGDFEGGDLERPKKVYTSGTPGSVLDDAIEIRNVIINNKGNIFGLEELGEKAEIFGQGSRKSGKGNRPDIRRVRAALEVAKNNFPEIANFKFVTERYKIDGSQRKQLNMVVNTIKNYQNSTGSDKLANFLPENMGMLYEKTIEKGSRKLPANPEKGLYIKMYNFGPEQIKYITDRITDETGKTFKSKDYKTLVSEIKDYRAGLASDARQASRAVKMNADIKKLYDDKVIQNLITGDLDNKAKKQILNRAVNLLGDDISVASKRLFMMAQSIAGTRPIEGIKVDETLGKKIIDTQRIIGKSGNGYAFSGLVYDHYGKVIDQSLNSPKGKSFIGYYQQTIKNALDKGLVPDEIFSVTASARRNMSPYAIFTQALDADVNSRVKGANLDSLLSKTHRDLQNIFKGKKYNQLNAKDKKAVNKLVEIFDNAKKDVLKDLKPKVRNTIQLAEFDLKNPPSKSIANYKSYDKNLQLAFDKSYKETGYSMKVSKDMKTQKEMINYLQKKKVDITNRVNSGIPLDTIFSTIADDLNLPIEQIKNVASKTLRGLGKAAVVVDPIFAALDFSKAKGEGVSGPEATKYTVERFIEGIANLPGLAKGAIDYGVDKFIEGKEGEDLKFETPYEVTFAQDYLKRKIEETPEEVLKARQAKIEFDNTILSNMTMVDDMEIPASKEEIDKTKKEFMDAKGVDLSILDNLEKLEQDEKIEKDKDVTFMGIDMDNSVSKAMSQDLATGGRVGFNGGGAVGADEDFAKELEYFLLNPDAELPKADSYRETMNPVALLNDMIDPRNYAYYADRLAETGIRIGEFGARVLPALGQLTADLIQRPAFKVTGGSGQGYVQDYTDIMPSNIKGTGIFTEFLDNLVGTEGTKVITEKTGLKSLIESEEQKQKDRRSTAGPKILADQVTLGAELTAPIFPGLKLLKAYAKNRKLPVNDTTKEILEKEIDEVLSAQNLTRRDFLKATGAGGTIILAKMLGFGDELATTTKVAEKVAKDTVGGTYPPPYFFKLVDKIKFMGDDVTEKAATKDREVVKRYKEYEMSEDVATGEITIVKRNEGSFYDQDGILSEEYIIYKPGMADETTKGTPPPEYEEFTVRPDSDGKLKDSEDGLDSLEEILEEVGDPDSLTLKK